MEASGSPVLFQGFPYRPPVLRGRLHDRFLDLVGDEVVGECASVGRRCSDLVAFEMEVAVDIDIGHDDGQHLLVDVNSRRSGTASASPWESGERASSHQ